MTITLHYSLIINDTIQRSYKIKCLLHSITRTKGTPRPRRIMRQKNVVEAITEDDKKLMPVLVLAMVTIEVGDDAFSPFVTVAPMVEAHQEYVYLPYPAYGFNRATKGGWVYKNLTTNMRNTGFKKQNNL